jgi:hypothetical protein
MKLFAAVVLLSVCALAQVQPAQSQPPLEPQDWIPAAVQDLAQAATSHSDFAFDHSMLVLASKVDQDDDSMRRIIAGIDGVSVHRFRFQEGFAYAPDLLNAVQQEYHAAGWEHLAAGRHKPGSAETELWFHLENAAIRNMAFLVVSRDHVNFVTISGSISPIDLLHIAGHFGIPPIEGGIKIPNTAASQGPSQQPGY